MLGFRKAGRSDLPFLYALREMTKREHVENSGLGYEKEKQWQRVEYQLDCAQIATWNGRDIGLLKVDRAVTPWAFSQIQIIPEFQRRGIGEKLVQIVLSEAGEQGVAVKLSVLKANPARRLYERLGFRVVEEKEHSLVMVWSER